MKKTLIVLILFLLIGCKSKKVFIETHTTDTINIKEIIKIQPSQLNSLIVDSPCDSLGKLVPFKFNLASGNDELTIKSVGNKIEVIQKKDTIITSDKEIYQSSTKTSKERVEVPYIPNWVYKLITILSSIIALETTYIFRKKIPYLKLLPF